jgi:transcriptional regulator with XRE-family HTH domain
VASFGEKLKEVREAAGLTQAQLAERSGIPLGTIREYEQNKREPLVSKAGKLARALGQTIEALLPNDAGATGEPAPKKGKKRKGD